MDEDAPVQDALFVPAGPKPIRPLSKDVINQIAAAEVRCFLGTESPH